MTRRRIILLALGAGALVVVGFFGIQGVRTWWAWQGVERVVFDPVEARNRLIDPADVGLEAAESDGAASPPPTYDAVEYDALLAVGKDFDVLRPERQESFYADAILLWLTPTNGGDPVLVSLPRDLIVVDPCTRQETKLDRTIAGCGEAVSGVELVALAVEDYTGIAIDHFAVFEFETFRDIINAVGGVEICVEHALREGGTDLIAAGCSTLDGDAALRWLQSRQTQELVDGEWRFVEGVSDAHRSVRQQQLMFAMLAKLKTMRDPTTLGAIAGDVGDSLVLDHSLSMGDAVAMVWDLRSVSASRIRRLVIPTDPSALPDGSFAVRATMPFQELLDG